MLHERHKLRAGWPSCWFLLVLLTGVACAPAWPQDQSASSTNSEETRLVAKMLDAKTPEEKLDLAKQVLKLNPNNQAAIKIREEALQELSAKQKGAEKQQQDQIEEKKKQAEGREALDQGRNALANGNIQEATRYMTIAKQAGVPGVTILERNIQYRNKFLSQMRYLTIGGAAAVVAGLAGALVWFKRKKTPYLELTEGNGKGTRYRIDQEITNIGAVEEYGDTRNDVVIADKFGAISRLHCQVRMKSGKPYLVDCGSANGTFVNGQRIPVRRLVPLHNGTQIDLAHGAKIRVGFERKKG